MDVDRRHRLADRPDDVRVVVAVNAGWIPPCRHTSVAPRSQASRTRRTISSRGTRYGAPRRFCGELPLRERAEPAAEVADVRVLDVPGDDVADLVAADLPPKPVRRSEDALRLPPRASSSLVTSSSPSSMPELERRRVAAHDERRRDGVARRPEVVPRQPHGIGGASHVRQDRRIEPALDRRYSGYTGSLGASSSPRERVASASCSSSGQGASGLTWSIVTGETPPQSSIPASSRRGNSSKARFGGA